MTPFFNHSQLTKANHLTHALLVMLMVCLGSFWGIEAKPAGKREALRLVAGLESQPASVVLTQEQQRATLNRQRLSQDDDDSDLIETCTDFLASSFHLAQTCFKPQPLSVAFSRSFKLSRDDHSPHAARAPPFV